MTTKTKYKQQWHIPSDSAPKGYYTVSLTFEDKYVCHCWPFLRNRSEDCKHIIAVKNGEGEQTQEFEFIPANVEQVTRDPKNHNRLLMPLIPLGNPHFLLTLVYDALQLGASWKALKERYDLPPKLTKTYVEEYIQYNGRLIYGDWVKGQGHVGYKKIKIG